MSATAPSADAVAGAGAPAAAPAKKESVSQWSTKKLIYMLRMINMLNGLALVACAIIVCILGGAFRSRGGGAGLVLLMLRPLPAGIHRRPLPSRLARSC